MHFSLVQFATWEYFILWCNSWEKSVVNMYFCTEIRNQDCSLKTQQSDQTATASLSIPPSVLLYMASLPWAAAEDKQDISTECIPLQWFLNVTPLILFCCCCYFLTPPQYGSWCTKHQVPLHIPSNLYIVWKRECCNMSVGQSMLMCSHSVYLMLGWYCVFVGNDGPEAQAKRDGLGWVLDTDQLWAALLKSFSSTSTCEEVSSLCHVALRMAAKAPYLQFPALISSSCSRDFPFLYALGTIVVLTHKICFPETRLCSIHAVLAPHAVPI